LIKNLEADAAKVVPDGPPPVLTKAGFAVKLGGFGGSSQQQLNNPKVPVPATPFGWGSGSFQDE
jgi:hypothetical protein